MDLDTFQNSPTTITENIAAGAISGPKGNSPANQTVNVAAGQGATETIEFISFNASEVQPTATVSQGPGQIQLSFASGSSGNCYGLPWGSGKAYLTKLQSQQKLFFTPKLNGCGFLVAGPHASPTVVHANADSPRLAEHLESFAAAAEHQEAVYSQFYGSLAAALIDKGVLPKENLQIFKPADYLSGDSSFASVFGVNNGGWKFYYNCRRATKNLWPNFQI